MADPKAAAEKIDAGNKGTSSQALIIQAYANSVKEQPPVDFTGEKNLEIYQTAINTGLKTAQGHADEYLNAIQPAIIQNITNISNYYALHQAVPATLPVGSTEQQWLDALGALKTQAVTYGGHARSVVAKLKTLRDNLSKDSAAFAGTVNDLNTAVNGDNGVLQSDDKTLSDIQGKINGAISAAVLSGLTVIGGVFMICVGAIEDFVTAGTTTPLIVGGIGVVIAGVAGEAGSVVALVTLSNQKSTLLHEEEKLKEEVKLALGMRSAYQSLSNQVNAAVEAAGQMQAAWEFLQSDLGSMINDLTNGISNVGTIRTLFLTGANTFVATILTDINTIKT